MNSAGNHIEPDINVEISDIFPIVMMSSLIVLFYKYGVELKAMNYLHANFLKILKLS